MMRRVGSRAAAIRPRLPRLGVRSYVFRAVLEPDGKAWHAYCPILKRWGSATWGTTKAEAIRHIHEVVRMVVDELAEEDIPIPEGPKKEEKEEPTQRRA